MCISREDYFAVLCMTITCGFGGFGGVVGWHREGRNAFGSVGVCDEACRLNGSRYESNIGSLCGWLTTLPPQQSVGKIDQMGVRDQGAPDSVSWLSDCVHMRNPLESGLSLKDWDVKFQLVWINGLLSLDVGPDICVQGLTTIELALDHDGQSFVGATKDLESGILGNGIILAVDWKMNIFGRTKDRWHGHLRREWPMIFHSVSWHFEEEYVRCTGFPSSADFSLF